MTDRASLGARLRDAAAELDLPRVDLRAAVMDRLADAGGSTPRPRPRWSLVAAAALVILVVATLAIAPARDAVAGWLGIGSTTVRHVPSSELPNGMPPQLGERVPVGPDGSPLPTLGMPASAFRDDRGVISYVWTATDELPELDRTGWGAILSVRPVDLDPGDLKLLAQDDEVDAVTVGRTSGLWIPDDHILTAPDQPPATAHHVLLWIAGPDQYRLETELPKQDAVELAETLEGTTGR